MEDKIEKRRAYFREHYRKNQPRLVVRDRERNREFRKKHPESASEYSRRYRVRCRYEAIEYYSKGQMCCACCGEKHYEFLNIDHINGDGNKMRRELVGHGNLGQWLKSRGFPEGFRVLCYNCNMSHGHYGYCPHNKESIDG